MYIEYNGLKGLNMRNYLPCISITENKLSFFLSFFVKNRGWMKSLIGGLLEFQGVGMRVSNEVGPGLGHRIGLIAW